jgi:hypothetical protein
MRPCHTWWGLCYDPDKKRMLFLESHKGMVFQDKASIAKAHGLEPKDPRIATFGSAGGDAWLFTFYPETREWKEVYTNVPKAREASYMEYLPDTKTIWWTSGNTYLFDDASQSWSMKTKGGAGGGGESAYDPESKKLVASNNQDTWVYDCATNAWTQVQKEALDGTWAGNSTFCYDSVAKKFVCFTSVKRKGMPDDKARLSLYDLKENQWSTPEVKGEFPKASIGAGYYDPARNVTVFYFSRETWVYRCKAK